MQVRHHAHVFFDKATSISLFTTPPIITTAKYFAYITTTLHRVELHLYPSNNITTSDNNDGIRESSTVTVDGGNNSPTVYLNLYGYKSGEGV